MRDVTVTGTSGTVTKEQRRSLAKLLNGADRVRHGMCQGADGVAHEVALNLDIPITGHAGVDSSGKAKMRLDADLQTYDALAKPRLFLTRNADMVKASTEVVALLAKQSDKFYRSGEWNTINTARKLCKPVTLVLPDGTVF